MIKIKKSKAGWRCQYLGKNSEILSTSEVLSSKANAWKNIRAICKMFNSGVVNVLDEDGIKYAVMIHHGKFEKMKIKDID